jgi:protein SCO1/2
MKKIFWVVSALLALGLAAFGLLVLRQQATAATVAERLPVNTRLGGELALPSTLGHPVNLKDWRGKVVLLDFGYTTCPDVCPTVLARLRQVLKELGPEAAQVQVVFVSFDPARDSLEHLRAYLKFFDPRMVGATGSEAEIAALARRYGVVYLKDEQGSAAGYGYSHSDYIYLLDTEGRVRKLYDGKATSKDMTDDIHALLPHGLF